MFYELKYQLKGTNQEIKEKYYYKEEVLNIIKQLNKGLTPIKKSLINGIDSLNYINIYEQNYDYIDDHGRHCGYKIINNNGEVLEVSEFSLDIDENFKPKKIEITAKLFLDNNIGIFDNKKISYINGLLKINGEIYKKFDNTKKYGEIIDYIFTISNQLNKYSFHITELEDHFDEYEFLNLAKNQLGYIEIRDTIKGKLEEIRNYYGMEKNIITLSKYSITINYN